MSVKKVILGIIFTLLSVLSSGEHNWFSEQDETLVAFSGTQFQLNDFKGDLADQAELPRFYNPNSNEFRSNR